MAKDIKVTLELDNKQFKTAVRQSEQQVKNFEGSSTKSLGLIKSAFLAVGGAAVLRSIVTVGSRFQDLQSSLDVVTGSAEAGAEAFKSINELALTTQFGVEELTTGFIQLKGAGVDPVALGFDSLEDLLFSFSNSASVTTDQVSTLQALLDATSRTVAGGLNLEDLIRIQDRGIPVFTIFNKTLGLQKDEITKVGKSAEGAAFLLKVLNESSDLLFAGALENRLTNTSTLFSNLQIAVKNVASALFVVLQPTIDSVLTKLTELSVGLFEVVIGSKTLSDVINELVPGFSRFIDILSNFSLIILLLTGPTAVRALIALLFSLGNSLLKLTGITVATNLQLTGFARLAGQVGSVLKQLFRPLNIVIALTLGLFLEFRKLNNTDFTFGEKLFIALVEVVRDLAQFVGIITVVGNTIGQSLAKSIVSGFRGENPFIVLADDISKNVAIGSGIGDAFADTLLGEELRKRIEENAKKNVVDPIEETTKTLEEIVAEQSEILQNILKTADQQEASEELETLRKKYEAEFAALLGAIEETPKSTEKAKTALQEFNEFLDALIPTTTSFDEVFAILQEKLGDDKTVKGIRDYESALRNLFDAFNISPFQDFIDSLDGVALTTEEYAQKQQILNALIQKYPELIREAEAAQDALNDALGDNEALTNFLDTLGQAQVTLSMDLAKSLTEGKDAAESFKNFFRQLVNQLIADAIRLAVIQPILSAIFGIEFGAGGSVSGFTGGGLFGLFRANGGPVMSNKPYIVGERGPELFVPNAGGTIIPNDRLMSQGGGDQVSYTINAVDAPSFQALVASDPEFIYNVTRVGARRLPGAR